MNSLAPVSLSEATRTWLRIGLLSFGGPAGQIAVMHRILVDEKRWISEQRFLHALSYCMLLPGPEAQQLATYVGWLLHGTRGGLIAGTLFVLPGFLAIMALSFLYVIWHQHPVLEGVLLGLKAAVIALVIQAVVNISRRALRSLTARLLALVSFLAIAIFHAPFPLIVLGAGLVGYLLARRGHSDFAAAASSAEDLAARPVAMPPASRALRVLAIGLPLWLAPVVVAAFWWGPDHLFTQLGLFFSKMSVVSFGGAYAVLAYVAQQAVERFAWITPAQMIDGLGLAETTPGPLILVVQFVGFLAAFQAAGAETPLLAATLGAVLVVWVTFVPSFLWIFMGAPYVEALRGNPAITSALNAITAAVVGVITSLALWFASHVLFEQVSARGVPELSSLQLVPCLLTALALLLTFAWRRGLALTIIGCAVAGASSSFW